MTYLADSKHTAYVWVNWLYMSEKQWGIQSSHCISDMSVMEYGKDIYQKWAKEDKTLIMFNGTNSGTIKKVYSILQFASRNLRRAGIEIPHVIFREDSESLDGAVTACGFILPDAVREVTGDDYLFSPEWAAQFFPEDAYVPPQQPISLQYMVDRVESSDALHKVLAERRAFGNTNYVDYSHDSFNIHEFTDWMSRQRLA